MIGRTVLSLRGVLTAVAAAAGLFLAVPVLLVGLPFWGMGFAVRAGSGLWRRMRIEASPWQELVRFEPVVGWRPRAGLRAYAEGSRVFRLTTDREGWRGRATLEDAGIVVFGDSFAFGHGADDGDFFADLRKHPTVKSVGANGYNMVQALLWMERLSDRLGDKLVVWFVYYGNDLYENLRPNLDRYRMPFVRQQEGSDWEIVTSHVREEPWPFPTPRRYYARLAEICCPTFLSERVFAACRYLIRRGQSVCGEAGASLAIMGIPDITQISTEGIHRLEMAAPAGQRPDAALPDRRLREICGQFGLPFVALRDHLGPEHHQEGDCHWNRRGHRRVAALLAELHARRVTSPATEMAPARHGDTSRPLREAVIP